MNNKHALIGLAIVVALIVLTNAANAEQRKARFPLQPTIRCYLATHGPEKQIEILTEYWPTERDAPETEPGCKKACHAARTFSFEPVAPDALQRKTVVPLSPEMTQLETHYDFIIEDKGALFHMSLMEKPTDPKEPKRLVGHNALSLHITQGVFGTYPKDLWLFSDNENPYLKTKCTFYRMQCTR